MDIFFKYLKCTFNIRGRFKWSSKKCSSVWEAENFSLPLWYLSVYFWWHRFLYCFHVWLDHPLRIQLICEKLIWERTNPPTMSQLTWTQMVHCATSRVGRPSNHGQHPSGTKMPKLESLFTGEFSQFPALLGPIPRVMQSGFGTTWTKCIRTRIPSTTPRKPSTACINIWKTCIHQTSNTQILLRSLQLNFSMLRNGPIYLNVQELGTYILKLTPYPWWSIWRTEAGNTHVGPINLLYIIMSKIGKSSHIQAWAKAPKFSRWLLLRLEQGERCFI